MKAMLQKWLPKAPAGETFAGEMRHAFVLRVENVFDADRIWQSRFALADHLLKHLLDQHRPMPGEPGVFTDVWLELPAESMQFDLTRSDGSMSRKLADNLQALHRQAFAQSTAAGRAPRYQVRKNPSLKKGEVRVCFGHAVYIAEPDETRVWRIECSRNGVDWQAVHDIYADQRVALIDQEAGHWPFGPHHAVIALNTGAGKAVQWLAEPADSLRIVWDAGLQYCKVLQDADDAAFFCIRVQPLTAQPPEARPAAQPLARPAAAPVAAPQVATVLHLPSAAPRPAAPAAQPTAAGPAAAHPAARVVPPVRPPAAVPPPPGHALTQADNTPAPIALPAASPAAPASGGNPAVWRNRSADEVTLVAKPRSRIGRLSLIGLALQRVSLFGEIGIQAVQIGFDAKGRVLPPGTPGVRLTVTVDADDRVRVGADGHSVELATGRAVPLSAELNLQHMALPELEEYLGWLKLPQPQVETLSSGRPFAFGRATPGVLRVLAGSGFVRAGQQQVDGDRMGISRQHFTLEAGEGGVMLDSCVQGRRLFCLDDKFNLLAVPEQGTGKVELRSGMHLLAGHYLLRWDAA